MNEQAASTEIDAALIEAALSVHRECYRDHRAGNILTFTCGVSVPLDCTSPERRHLATVVKKALDEGRVTQPGSSEVSR